MRLHTAAGTVVAGASLAVVGLAAAPASAQEVYPPAAEEGTVSAAVVPVDVAVNFGGCGFANGARVTVAANRVVVSFATVRGGCFTSSVTFSTIGVKTLTGTGLAGANPPARGTATHGGAAFVPLGLAVDRAPRLQLALATGRLRTVTAIVTVRDVADGSGSGGGSSAGGAGGGGLPFTGAQTGVLAVTALGLAGGGVALRVAARRRRGDGTPPSQA